MAVTVSDLIRGVYFKRTSSYERNFRNPNNSYRTDNTNLENRSFVKYLKVNLAGNKLELPCAYKSIITGFLHNNVSHPHNAVNTLYIPLYSILTDTKEARTSLSGLRAFFLDGKEHDNLTYKKVGSSYYFGNSGMLLYEDMTPLLLFTLDVDKLAVPMGNYNYETGKQHLYINSEVYSRNDLLSKYIRTKLISNVIELSGNDSFCIRDSYSFYFKTNPCFDFTISIEDLSRWFETPVRPTANFTNDGVYEYLSKNLSKIFSDEF